MTECRAESGVKGTNRLGAATLLDDHAGQVPVDDVHIVVVVEHRDGRDAPRRAARAAAGASGRGHGGRRLLVALPLLLDDVRVGELLVVEERAVAGAVVGRVAARNDDEVPAERLEVDDERVAAAALLGRVFVAVEVERALGARRRTLLHLDLQVRLLHGAATIHTPSCNVM